MSKKIKNVTSVDEHGEIVSEIVTFVEYKSKEHYVMKYMGNTEAYKKLTSISSVQVFEVLTNIMEYNTGRVFLTSFIRSEIMTELEISKSTLSIALKALREAGFIVGSRNDYLVNPNIVWYGDNESRHKAIGVMKDMLNPNPISKQIEESGLNE